MVIGAGPIGLAVLEFVKLIGCRIIVVDNAAEPARFREEKVGHRALAPSQRQAR